ncbi:MAG TPA: hypothetical protein VH540_03445 [Ktedonobacterales bacterium]|jgi:hypothetical protein
MITSVLPDLAGALLRYALLYTAGVQDTPAGFHAHAVDQLTEEGQFAPVAGEVSPGAAASPTRQGWDSAAEKVALSACPFALSCARTYAGDLFNYILMNTSTVPSGV